MRSIHFQGMLLPCLGVPFRETRSSFVGKAADRCANTGVSDDVLPTSLSVKLCGRLQWQPCCSWRQTLRVSGISQGTVTYRLVRFQHPKSGSCWSVRRLLNCKFVHLIPLTFYKGYQTRKQKIKIKMPLFYHDLVPD